MTEKANNAILLSDCKCVGNGSFGRVYTGIHNGKVYAVKRRYIADADTAPPGCVHLNEIWMLREMKHPNILHAEYIQRQNPIPDKFRQDAYNPFGENVGVKFRADLVYVLSDAADGDISRIVLSKSGKLENDEQKSELRSILWQILSALAYLHAKGIMHRDIKPYNVLYTDRSDGKLIQLCDFDMCLPVIPFYETSKSGTPEYTPPEILSQGLDVVYTPKVDIWGVGCIMHHLLHGEPMFVRNGRMGDDLDSYILAAQTAFFPNSEAIERRVTGINISDVRIDFDLGDSDATDLLRKMLDCDPNKRPSAVECMQHPFFQAEKIPEFLPMEDHIIEKHYITEEMAAVFDNYINGTYSRTPLTTNELYGFFLGLDILMRVCTKKYRGSERNLAICCFNLGMKFFDKESARFEPIDTEDAKRIEYSIVAEKLGGKIYRNNVYNELGTNPEKVYRYLMAPEIFPQRFSTFLDGVRKQLGV